MDEIKIFHDRQGKTLTIWFGDPEKESICEETSEEVILIKDEAGTVIGFEKLNYDVRRPHELRVILDSPAG